eukprot:TRINITY_DN650_c0_g1_i5.p2 TRINITY_DN650_c0_g1~~TRINITY_DN650_c0_g1_i5.p2  ORF type:complete len:117 (-),score=15.30 TRINITY_DN650_c0_g1_i5:68-418(-)
MLASCPPMPDGHHTIPGAFGRALPADETFAQVMVESRAPHKVTALLNQEGINAAEDQVKPCFYRKQIVKGARYMGVCVVDGVDDHVYEVIIEKSIGAPAVVESLKLLPHERPPAIV